MPNIPVFVLIKYLHWKTNVEGNSDGCFQLLPYSSVLGRVWWSQLSCTMTVGKLPCGCPESVMREPQLWEYSFTSVLGFQSQSTAAHSWNKVPHFAFVHSNQVPEQGKLLLSRYVKNKMQWNHLRDCNPVTHGSHQPTPLQERSTQPPCLVLPPMQWKKDVQVITPHDSSSGCAPCFPLREVGCRRQIYSDVEDICL